MHRTSLKTIRHLGSAHEGTTHFIRQRVTGIANAILILVLTGVAIALAGRPYPEAIALVGNPFVAVPLALAIISVCIHLRLGIQVVVEDYVHAEGAKMLLLIGNTFLAALLGATGLWAIARIALTQIVASS
ncbi:succinate dehydrogenase, hydrophobic membrane anchor protein [Acuticoccus sp. MNP-M23]|nr:succinate dehydrogenase, hydrophobic membrane anchor protein [Acuticoccus sp. MNP-M23]WMS45032.1 succinate dehydrogenase, hydrophobic membrane anchor protein [Acuticoccus sp. MNP-M23]